YSVVIERSHFEDPVFIRHLLQSGHVSTEESDAYTALWERLSARARLPDVAIALRVTGDTAYERVSRAEREGARPREFQSDGQKRRWLARWADLYDQRFTELAADGEMQSRIL